MRFLSQPSPRTPDPGRTVVSLGGRWTAVILDPIPGHSYRVIGFFEGNELAEFVDEPPVVRRILRWLERRARAQFALMGAERPSPPAPPAP